MSRLTILPEWQLRPGDRLLTDTGVERVETVLRHRAKNDPNTYVTTDGASTELALMSGKLVAVEAPAQHEVQAWWDALDDTQRRALVAHNADDLLRAREDVVWHEACAVAELKGMAAALDGQPSAPTPSPEGSYGLELCYEMGYGDVISDAHSTALIEHLRRALVSAAIPLEALAAAEAHKPLLAPPTHAALLGALGDIRAALAASDQ